jgi:AAA family ATP:ADP antiporter
MREVAGVAGGVRNLPWLFTGTLVTMLVIHPAFAALVARLSRRRFVSIAYRFFMLNLVIFYALLRLLPPGHTVWVGRAFYVWISVFNLFVVSIFWAVMVDLFRSEQAKRLFAFIAVGGTVGGITGSLITAGFAELVGPVQLLLVSVVLLELGVQCMRRLTTVAWEPSRRLVRADSDPEKPIGGSFFAGMTHAARSPYLLGICGYMMLFTLGSTFLYFHQATLVGQAFTDPAVQTAFFAKIDLAVNILTLVTQAFLTGRIIKLLGIALTLTLLPALTVVGFAAFGFVPTLGLFVVFQVLRRSGEFAIAKPSREVLYTVVSREDKYKAKNFIDTFVYRAGDQIAAWSYILLGTVGLGVVAISFVAAPLAAVWLVIAFWLGGKQAVMAGGD